MHSVFYQNLKSKRIYYDEMLQKIQSMKKIIPMSNDVNYSELFTQILGDHPELFYVRPEFTKKSSFFSSEIVLNYIYTPNEIRAIATQLNETADKLIANMINEHQSEYDKVRIFHDYLKSEIQYDSEAAINDDLENKYISESHTIVGALINHRCVCEGFAKAMKFLCDKIGLICFVISGKGNSMIESGPHSWNIVRINGYYHHVDVTWDNQYAKNPEIPNYGYFNLSDDEISKDHTWIKKNYPACPIAPYNYFRVNNSLIDSEKQLENFLTNNFLIEEQNIMFKVVRGSQLERVIQGSLQDIISRSASRCKYVSITQFKFNYIMEQLTFCVQPEYH